MIACVDEMMFACLDGNKDKLEEYNKELNSFTTILWRLDRELDEERANAAASSDS
jgi:hypothetical protein